MATTAGALSQVSVSSNSSVMLSAVATAGTGPYTYQWYRSTTTGFTPGAGNILAGQTALTLNDSGLIPNTVYFYKVIATDSGSVAGTSAQISITTTPTVLQQNSLIPGCVCGQLDLKFNDNTLSAQIDVSAGANVYYQGQAMKIVANTAGGTPKVIGCTSKSDNVFGFINFDMKSVSFAAGANVELSLSTNVMYLYTTGAITQGAQVCLDTTATAAVQATGNSATVVGFALDGAAAAGALIRVFLLTPSYLTA